MNKVSILQIGIGFHARRIYVPTVIRLSKDMPVELKAGVELVQSKPGVEEYLRAGGIDIAMAYIQPAYGDVLDAETAGRLDELVKEQGINAVIISTDPIAHKPFAKWALSRGLHILMDKPITTRSKVSSSLAAAKGLVRDFEDLCADYMELQKTKETIFSVMVQRRYEAGYKKVFELIREVGERFNAPVTSIQASHSDGVWIFPDEVVEQKSHPYSTGYGKCSHSGYHIFDIIWQFYQASGLNGKGADAGEAMTSFLSPRGLLQQFGQKDFSKYFPDYHNVSRRTDEQLWDEFDEYGEIDAFSIVRLLRKNETICNISTNLIHNGFSRRSWAVPNNDLYKGNGRVKHQTYSIQQGPFQNIQIHQYQSDDKHDQGGVHDETVGGNNHFDIYVFRNSAMFGAEEPALKKYSPKDFDTEGTLDSKRLHNESVKDSVIREFIQFVLGEIPKSALKSNITSHETSVKIMSAIYQSQARQVHGQSPIARFDIGRPGDA